MERCRQPELMDDPELDPAEHRRALRGLARIHRLSLTVRYLWSEIRDLAAGGDGKLRILDLASGGGEVAVGLWCRAQRVGTPVRVTGVDISPVAVRRARELAAAREAAVRFQVGDVLRETPPGDYDVIMSSLFLHHLDRAEAVTLLRRVGTAAHQRIVMDDLRRSLPGWLLARCATRLLTRSPVVHVDGPRSVSAAFTPEEARSLATEAGLADLKVRHHWPFRFLLVGRPA